MLVGITGAVAFQQSGLHMVTGIEATGAFNDLEHRFTLLLIDGIAKNPARQPDVVAKRPVLFQMLSGDLQTALSV